MHRIGVLQERGDQGVTDFVISRNLLLGRGENVTFALRPEHHLLHRTQEIVLGNLLAIFARGQNRRLVHQVGQVGTGETGGAFGNHLKIHFFTQRFFLNVDGQNFFPIFLIGLIQDYAPVEASRPQERRIKDIGPVGRRHHNHLLARLEAVHLH
ncbi:hypothetical protein BK006_00330 [bacterium CG10_49_38]|nr:MAG: hypothetical protein BK006_00330 [bacterium CG10_49_38]